MKKLHHSSDLAALEKIAEAKGFKPAPPDHSIYSEGPTLMFMRHSARRAPSERPQKTPDSPSADAASGVVDDHK